MSSSTHPRELLWINIRKPEDIRDAKNKFSITSHATKTALHKRGRGRRPKVKAIDLKTERCDRRDRRTIKVEPTVVEDKPIAEEKPAAKKIDDDVADVRCACTQYSLSIWALIVQDTEYTAVQYSPGPSKPPGSPQHPQRLIQYIHRYLDICM